MSPDAGGRIGRKGRPFIDGNQTGLDGDEADARDSRRRRKVAASKWRKIGILRKNEMKLNGIV